MTLALGDKIKIIRARTGASYILCKEALLKNNFDIDLSITYIKSLVNDLVILKQDKKVKFGTLYSLITEAKKTILIIEAQCETDFVAKSTDFILYLNKIALLLLNNNYDLNFYKKFDDISNDTNISFLLNEMISLFKENIIIRRIRKFSVLNGYLYSYTHKVQNINKICAFLLATDNSLNYKNIANDIVMHITAINPKYLSIDHVPLSIFNNLDQPSDISIRNFYVENVLLEQFFVKNNSINISNLIDKKFDILHFERFEIGEDF